MEDVQRKESHKKKKWNCRLRSLSKELAISLSFLLIFCQGVLLAYVYNRQSRLILQNLETMADNYTRNLRDVLVVPILNLDDEQIGKIGLSFLQKGVVDKVHIKNSLGKTLFRTPGGQDKRRHLQRSIDIIYKDQVIGHADLFFSMNSVEKDLAWLRNTFLLVLLTPVIVIFITTGILLRVFMRRPLDIIQRGIESLAGGDVTYGFDEIHHLEFSGIAERFKEMAAGIQARECSFQELNKELQNEMAMRRLAEEGIRESEAKSRALLTAIPDMVFQIDRHGCFLDFHRVRKDLFPEPQCLLGQRIDKIFPPDLSALHHKKATQALATHQLQIYEYELPINGNQAYFESRMVAISDEAIMAVVRDITRIKQDAADKFRLEEQLRKAQKMEAVGMLAGRVAHDLNNVLSGLVSYPELILMDLPEDSPLRPSILAILHSGEKTAEILQDMLTLTRRGVAVSEMVNLNDIIADFLLTPEYEKLKHNYPEVKLEIDLYPNLLNIQGSYLHLSKTVMNLVTNAAESMPEGGTITVSSENRYIDKPIRGYDDIEEGDYVILTVLDNGIGISAQNLEKIFESFYTKKVMGRSGIGLAMAVVLATVEDHDGYIDAQSTGNRKTTFSIYLPTCRKPPCS